MARALVQKVSHWYHRFERPISSISLVGGFVFDILTLQRVDEFWENLWIVGHIVIVAAAIILINRIETGEAKEEHKGEWHFWLINILQFFFGGLLSTFLVFYFRSATLVASWPFLLILVCAFMANERLKQHFERLTFQIAFLFLSIFLFAIYIVPVIVHSIGPWIFLLSGVASLVLISFFLFLLRAFSHERFKRSRRLIIASITVIFALLHILYFTNLIPPIPISLANAGIYYSISKDATGEYVLDGEPHTWKDYFKLVDTVHIKDNSLLYAYTAIFSPTKFSTQILHIWQHYDTATEQWETTSKIPLAIIGGREEGYRTYSIGGVVPGRWRVDVETPQGQLIGRIDFEVTTN